MASVTLTLTADLDSDAFPPDRAAMLALAYSIIDDPYAHADLAEREMATVIFMDDNGVETKITENDAEEWYRDQGDDESDDIEGID